MSAAEVRAITELRAEVTAMKAELARRDIEQIEIEGAVEYLQDAVAHSSRRARCSCPQRSRSRQQVGWKGSP